MSASSSFALIDKSRRISASALQLNNGELLASACVPSNSPLRRPLFNALGEPALRDGVSDFTMAGCSVAADGELRPAPLSAEDEASAAVLVDVLSDKRARLDDVRQALGQVPRVPNLLLAPLMRAFTFGAESPLQAELRRAAYADTAFQPDRVNLRRSQGVDEESLAELRSQIAKDTPRTIPRGFGTFFSEPRIQKLLQRLLVRLALDNPLTGYLQGLGDIAAVFLVTFVEACAATLEGGASTLSDVQLLDVEADTYSATMVFVARFSHVFLDVIDGEAMRERMALLEADLCAINAPLVAHLREIGCELQFFAHRFHLCFLTRELPLRSCQRLFLAYLALSPRVDVTRLHSAVIAAFLDLMYAQTLLRCADMGDAMLAVQSAPALYLRDDLVDELLLSAAERVLRRRAYFDRQIALLALSTLVAQLSVFSKNRRR